MPIDPVRAISPVDALTRAVDDRQTALERPLEPASNVDRVVLSPSALARSDSPIEEAVVDRITTKVAVEAAAAVLDAERERVSALVFVLAHHGPPL